MQRVLSLGLALSLKWLLQQACITWDGGERKVTYERCHELATPWRNDLSG